MAFNARGRPALGSSPGDGQSHAASTARHRVSGLAWAKCTIRSWCSTSSTSQKPDRGVLGCLITRPGSPCPDLAGRAPFTEEGESPRKLLIFLFHWRTMLETERAPDSGSEEVVLAETSAPESSMAGFWLVLPATRSDMGLARRRSAETCPEEGQRRGCQTGVPGPNPSPSPPGLHRTKSGSSGDPKPRGHLSPMGFPLLPRSPFPAAGRSCPGRWAIPLLPVTTSHLVTEPQKSSQPFGKPTPRAGTVRRTGCL